MAGPETSPHTFPARFPTEDAVFAWADQQDGRHGLVDGEAVPRTDAPRDHGRVAGRVFAALSAQVDEARIVVGRQDRRSAGRASATAQVVIEVLSPSTDFARHLAEFDRSEAVESLLRCLVLDQAASVAQLRAETASRWPVAPARIGADSTLDVTEIDAAAAMAHLYRPVGAQVQAIASCAAWKARSS